MNAWDCTAGTEEAFRKAYRPSSTSSPMLATTAINFQGPLPRWLYKYASEYNTYPYFLYFYTKVYMVYTRSQQTYFHKRPDSKYFSRVHHMVSATAQCCHCRVEVAQTMDMAVFQPLFIYGNSHWSFGVFSWVMRDLSAFNSI